MGARERPPDESAARSLPLKPKANNKPVLRLRLFNILNVRQLKRRLQNPPLRDILKPGRKKDLMRSVGHVPTVKLRHRIQLPGVAHLEPCRRESVGIGHVVTKRIVAEFPTPGIKLVYEVGIEPAAVSLPREDSPNDRVVTVAREIRVAAANVQPTERSPSQRLPRTTVVLPEAILG